MAKKLKLGNDLINAVKEIILNTSYPIGRIIVSIDNVNPGTYLGGTWEQISRGRTLVGVGEGTDSNNNKKTFAENTSGGEYTHKLSEAEMPKHNHKTTTELGCNGLVLRWDNKSGSQGYWGAQAGSGSYQSSGAFALNTLYTTEKGSSAFHNNVQPYLTVYFWKRTA